MSVDGVVTGFELAVWVVASELIGFAIGWIVRGLKPRPASESRNLNGTSPWSRTTHGEKP